MRWIEISSILSMAALAGCATPQTISIMAVPSGAAISIESEYVGESPAAYSMSDVDDFDSLRIAAEMPGYEASIKTVTKKPGGLFPGKVLLQLEPKQLPETSQDAARRSTQPTVVQLTTREPVSQRFEVECRMNEVSRELQPWTEQ